MAIEKILSDPETLIFGMSAIAGAIGALYCGVKYLNKSAKQYIKDMEKKTIKVFYTNKIME